MTFEQDLIDLGWHHMEFQMRQSFAYTVMSLDEAVCLGRLYIGPATLRGYDAVPTSTCPLTAGQEAQGQIYECSYNAIIQAATTNDGSYANDINAGSEP
jgi:hypothetical protein